MNMDASPYETGFNHGLKNKDPEHEYVPESKEFKEYFDGYTNGFIQYENENEIEEGLDDVNKEQDTEMNSFFNQITQHEIFSHVADILTISKFVIFNKKGFFLVKIDGKYVLVSSSGNENITSNVFAMLYDYCKKHENPEFSITEEETKVINNFQETYLGTEDFNDIIAKLENAFRETCCNEKSLK